MADNVAAIVAAIPQPATIGIVGAGAMGSGIAQVSATAGHTVLLFDTRPEAAQTSIRSIVTTLEKLAAKGRLTPTEAAATASRLHPAAALADLAPCELVIEAIVEDLNAKRDLFRSLEAIVPANAILCSNTSSLSITAIAEALTQPQRLAGMHFFNPAPLLPLVEIVSGAQTSCAIAEKLHATATAWRKIPVHARSTPGFIVNRVARPFYAEALLLLAAHSASPATLDAIFRDCGGFRMGPFELMDLIGHDVNYAVTTSVFEAFNRHPRFAPSPLQKALVDAGHLGRKSGQGFFPYFENTATPPPDTLPATMPAPAPALLHRGSALAAALAQKLQLPQQPAHPDGRVATLTHAVLYITDGRTAAERAAANHEPHTILIDIALDYTSTPRLALAASTQAAPQALAEAASFLTSASFLCSQVADTPGMVILRTVAMLSNEAAFALEDRVASPADIDLAMQKGVNYPRGPLAWADALGVPCVVSALDHIHAATGEPRYAVAPLLRRKALAGETMLENTP